MPDRPPTGTPRSNELFFQIVAAVSLAETGGLSVRTIAKELSLDPTVVAQCIGLHVHLNGRNANPVPLPLPTDYWIPEVDEIITASRLDPGAA